MKAVVAAFNQEKALVGAFSVSVKLQTLRRFVPSSNAQCSAQLCSDQIISNYRGQGQQPAQAVASEELPAALIPNFLARVLLSFLINHPGFYKYLIPGSLDYELFTMPTPKPITN